MEAINWTNVDAVGVFTLDAVFGDYKGHAV